MEPEELSKMFDLRLNGQGFDYAHKLEVGFKVGLLPDTLLAAPYNFRATEAYAFAERYQELFKQKFKLPEGYRCHVNNDRMHLNRGASAQKYFYISIFKENEASADLAPETFQAEFNRVHQEIAAEIGEPEIHAPVPSRSIKKADRPQMLLSMLDMHISGKSRICRPLEPKNGEAMTICLRPSLLLAPGNNYRPSEVKAFIDEYVARFKKIFILPADITALTVTDERLQLITDTSPEPVIKIAFKSDKPRAEYDSELQASLLEEFVRVQQRIAEAIKIPVHKRDGTIIPHGRTWDRTR